MPTSLFTANQALVGAVPLHILSNGKFGNVPAIAAYSTFIGRAAVAWPVNNLAVYSPISLPSAFTISRFLVLNGAGTTGNVDIGLYSNAGVLLLSTGSTSRSGVGSLVQYINVTARSFPAGAYYLALLCASTSGTIDAIDLLSTIYSQATGALEETLGATALPATMTPVRYARTQLWNYGFTQSASL